MLLLSADTLVGTPVQNPAGEDLGHIRGIMLDVKRGCIAYAVLDFGGFLGIGDKYFAMPWHGFTLNTAREIIIIDIPKERLKNAEGFDKDDWPDLSDPEFARRIYTYYGVDPYWEITAR